MSPITASNKRVIVLVDADGPLYAAALQAETFCDGEQLQLLSREATYANAARRIHEQLSWVPNEVDVADVFVCLSDRKNFRTEILPSYKGNRKATPRPLALDDLRADFADRGDFKVMLIKGLEADDVCGIAAGTFQKAGYETIIISPDKDLLQIPGYVLVPSRDGTKPELWEVTPEAADDWHLTQTLAGDTCDGYKGCYGWGAVKAGFLIDQFNWAELRPHERWAEVVDAFKAAGLTEEDALVQARVSRILRVTDWDATKKAPVLFTFPEAPRVDMAA